MPSYLVLYFSPERRVRSVETLTAPDLAAAQARALVTMQGQIQAQGYELWLAGKKMAAHFVPDPASGDAR
jgi:hypothetical protein